MTWYFSSLQRVVRDVYNWLLPLVTINILWFLLSLTLILFPAATAALYKIAYQASIGREPYVRDYLGFIRKWFIKSWIWASLSLVLVFASYSGVVFYGGIFQIVSILLTAFIGLVQFYFWPYMFLQEQPMITAAFRNAVLTVLSDPLFALMNGLLTILLLIVSILLIAPVALIAPISIAFLGIYNLQSWLEHKDLIPSNSAD